MRYISEPTMTTRVRTAPRKTMILRALALQSGRQLGGLADEVGELEHAEDPQQAQGADDHEGLGAGDDQAQVGGEDRQQIDDPEKAAGVLERSADAIKPQHVLNGEEDGHDPL